MSSSFVAINVVLLLFPECILYLIGTGLYGIGSFGFRFGSSIGSLGFRIVGSLCSSVLGGVNLIRNGITHCIGGIARSSRDRVARSLHGIDGVAFNRVGSGTDFVKNRCSRRILCGNNRSHFLKVSLGGIIFAFAHKFVGISLGLLHVHLKAVGIGAVFDFRLQIGAFVLSFLRRST